jgi:hypothetical protein
MAENNNVNEIISELTQEINGNNGKDPKNMSLESLVLLLTAERLHRLEEDSRKQMDELRKRQEQVSFLHKLMKTVNTATGNTGNVDISPYPDLLEMLKKAKEMGVELDEKKTSYNNDERERLVENLRMTVEDLNVQNDMQLQMISRMTNERYESYQMARAILKPLHDAKLSNARYIAGR